MIAFIKTHLLPALLCSCALLTGCSTGSDLPSDSSKLVERLKDKKTFEILSQPDAVFIYGTRPNPDTFFQIVTEPKRLTADQMRKVKKLLLSDSSYLFDRTKKCLFIPQAAFKFVKDGEEAIVLVSMSCNQLRFMLSGRHATLDYDPVLDQLAPLLNELLPSAAEGK